MRHGRGTRRRSWHLSGSGPLPLPTCSHRSHDCLHSQRCRRTLAPIGIPRSTFYDWYSRYQEGGIEALVDVNQPGGNITGVTFLSTVTEAIRLQMLHEAVPGAAIVGLLVNPSDPNSEPDIREVKEAALKLGLELHVVSASNSHEIDAAFATLVERRVQAIVIEGDSFFSDRRQQLAALATRHGMPSIFASRELPDAGGLMSYGASNIEPARQAGIYVGRILRGEKPANLPVQQSVKVELVINLIVAKALGIDFPLTLLGRANEVIE